MQGTFTPL